MSDTQLINFIRSVARYNRIFNRLTLDERRAVTTIAGGETEHLEEIFEFVLEGRKQNG